MNQVVCIYIYTYILLAVRRPIRCFRLVKPNGNHVELRRTIKVAVVGTGHFKILKFRFIERQMNFKFGENKLSDPK